MPPGPFIYAHALHSTTRILNTIINRMTNSGSPYCVTNYTILLCISETFDIESSYSIISLCRIIVIY